MYGAATSVAASKVRCTCRPGSAGSPAAACSASAPAGLSRSRAMRQLTSSHAWCRSLSGALHCALASRQISITPRSLGLPMVWLQRLKPCARSVAITASRSRGLHLDHRAELFVEQRFERELLAARAHLRGPVLGVAVFGAAVADAVAFGDQQVHVEAHAQVAGKRHLAHRGPQAAIAAVVVGEQLVLRAQFVDGGDQALEQRGVVEVGHACRRTG